jgi:signal transduction histidine kinase
MNWTVRPCLGWAAMGAGLCVTFAGASPRGFLVPGLAAVVLAVAVRWGPGRHIAPAAVLTAAGTALWMWQGTGLESTAVRVGASTVWTLPAVLALVVGGYPRLTAYRRVSVVERARRVQRLQLARDLHDFVAHEVSGIVAQAQAARFVADTRPEAGGRALERIETAGLAALATMDQVVRMLRDSADDPEPLPTLADLPGVVDRFRGAGHPDIRLTLTPEAVAAPRRLAATAYRVVVEALTNIRRHAPAATRVEVSVTGGARGVEVRVRNDAAGPPARPREPSAPGGWGLPGLRERVAASGGTLTAGPCGHGWEVVAVIPGRPR